MEPSARATSIASTWVAVTPTARQCGRPRSSRRSRRSCTPAGTTGRARSGGRGRATARVRSRLSTPGSTQATRWLGVDLEHAVDLGRDDDQRVADRGRAAGEAGATPRPRTPGRGARAIRTAAATRGRVREADGGGAAGGDAGVAGVQRELERLGPRAVVDRVRRARSASNASCDGRDSIPPTRADSPCERAESSEHAERAPGAQVPCDAAREAMVMVGRREWVSFDDPDEDRCGGRST